MISFAPGFISRRFFTAAGFDMPSQIVALSRCRSAKEYPDGSVFSRYAADMCSTSGPPLHILHQPEGGFFELAVVCLRREFPAGRLWVRCGCGFAGGLRRTLKTGTKRTGSPAEKSSGD